jgi:hypothetical protein
MQADVGPPVHEKPPGSGLRVDLVIEGLVHFEDVRVDLSWTHEGGFCLRLLDLDDDLAAFLADTLAGATR